MARASAENSVSLFPFLSILACVIGVLTLMIATLVLEQLDRPDVELLEKMERAVENRRTVTAAHFKIQELRRMIAEAEELRRQLQAAREQLAKLEKEKLESADSKSAIIRLLAEIDALKKRIELLTPELAKLEAAIRELTAELAKRKEPPKPAEVRIRPSGSGSRLVQPIFVEVTASGVVVHGQGEPEPKRFVAGELRTNLEFIGLLDYVAENPDKSRLIFLVRPDAAAVHRTARAVAVSRNAPHGDLPVIGQGVLDLSLFNQ